MYKDKKIFLFLVGVQDLWLCGYADYHLIKREAYEIIGKLREDLSFALNTKSEYMERK